MNIDESTYMNDSLDEQQKCFVGYSHGAPWHDDLISACETTLPKFGLQAWYADDQFKPTKSLRDKVVEMIATARYGIYDLSLWRMHDTDEWVMPRNVLIELGMAIAFNRPVLLLRHAANRSCGLKLPPCLMSISDHILEFSGEHTLRQELEKRLPQWINVSPERTWLNRYCLFGQRVCTYREIYPHIEQWRQGKLCCHISDGSDVDRVDFRSVVESELERYNDVSYNYLDTLPMAKGYEFLLCSHCQLVRSTPFAIYRITPQTSAETFIAIGMSIALETQFKCEIPKLLFTTNAQDVPSLLSAYEVVEAANTKERKGRLRKFLPIVMHQVRESTWKPQPLPFEIFISENISISQEATVRDNQALENARANVPHFKTGQEIKGVVVTSTNELRQKAPQDTRAYLRYETFSIEDVLIVVSNEAARRWKPGETHLCLFISEEIVDKCVLLKCEPKQGNINQLLRRARLDLGLTLEELAMRLGISVISVSRWERGSAYPNAYARTQLCRIFNLSAEDLGFTSESLEHQETTKKPSSHPLQSNKQLRQERVRRGWSQADLADKVGCDAKTIGRWEAGIGFPRPYHRQKLCEIFGKNAEELGLIPENHLNDELTQLSSSSVLETTSILTFPKTVVEDEHKRTANVYGEDILEGTNKSSSRPLLFDEQLRRERKRRGWSQADLAMMVGCDTKTVGRWEGGFGTPRPYHRQKLCEIFGKNAEELGLI